MPAFPCAKCQAPVETSGDGRCKKCGEKKPFKCSRCEQQIDILSIYLPEKLTFKRPLYCRTCGREVENVECKQCGLSLIRSEGKEVTFRGEELVYHHECYDRQLRIFRIMRPILVPIPTLLLGHIGFTLGRHSGIGPAPWILAAVGLALGAFIGIRISQLFAPRT